MSKVLTKPLRNRLIQLLIILLLTFLAYSNIFDNQFVWDDQFFILQWDKIKNLGNINDILTGALPPRYEGTYRPLMGVFYLLAYSFFGTNPFGYHILSLAVHLSNTILVYLITRFLLSSFISLNYRGFMRYSHRSSNAKSSRRARIFANNKKPRTFIPFLTALLFGLHPIQTEAVTYIAASFNTIGITFFLASFYFYLKAREISSQFKIQNFRISASRIWYFCSIALALMAFFTYEFTLTLPFLLVSYYLIFDKHRKGKRSSLSLIPYFLAAGLYLFVRIAVIHTVGRGSYLLGSFYYTMLAMTKVHLIYLRLLLLPINQSINHLIPPGFLASHYLDPKAAAVRTQSLLEPMIIFSLITLLLLVLTAIKSFKKYPLITFSIVWFYLALAPASNIIPVQELMAERYLYLPSLSFFWILAFLTYYALSYSPRMFTLKVHSEENNSNLSMPDTSEEPRSSPCHHPRSPTTAYHHRDSTQMNQSLLRDDEVAYDHLGGGSSKLVEKHDFPEVKSAQPVVKRQEKDSRQILWNKLLAVVILLAIFYFYLTHQRNTVWHNSITFWSDAAAKSPISEIAYYNLGNAYLKKENLPAAITAYQKAITNNPNSIAYFNLGNTYYQQKEYDKTIDTYKKGLLVHSNSVELLINLGLTYEKQKNIELARQSYLKVLVLEPENERVRNYIRRLKER